ncbi:hypothetical protein [Vibrio sp. EA2]|uniref:hypothetical protein n=1 Tax=Vibrio sp. EA2 TaxID=3079860 RepID=UPI0029496AE7|nr:hypothetical protein [Vibrio sp. EA2]MDV6252399.1 hypothetical protein [Vibrio sp. EA2]
MPLIYLRKLFFLLLATVLLPVHVSTAQADQKAHLPHFSKLQPFVAASTSPISDDDFSEESTRAPASEGHANSDTSAIFNSQRWLSHVREGLDDEDVEFVGDLDAPFYADVSYSYSLININWRQNQSVFHHFTSDYRLSGWKETNAMYVALNSQFPA